MKCQICNVNEANIIFTQIINNEKSVLKICTECAKKKGISIEIEKPSLPQDSSLIGSFTGFFSEKGEPKDPDLTCKVCGLTFTEFKKNGLFGCDKCHEAFKEYVSNLLKHIHGTDVYEGKTPEELSEKGEIIQQLKKLQIELRQCIKSEDYEHAAELRDMIAGIEEKIKK